MLARILPRLCVRTSVSRFVAGAAGAGAGAPLRSFTAPRASQQARPVALPSSRRWFASVAAETSSGATPETLEFQAETRKLLDIVAGALYTEKEVCAAFCACCRCVR
jgi:hypothetical protein